MRIGYLIELAALTAACALLAACGSTARATRTTATETGAAPCAGPVRVVILADKTGSAAKNRTPEIRPEELDPLFEQIARCGGEIAAGILTDRSNRPLLRVRVDEPTPPPAATDPRQNPFDYARRHAEEVKTRSRLQKDDEERQADASERIREFDQAAKPLLAASAKARCSDIFGGLRRANLFHREPPSLWKRAPRQFTVLVSDAEANCGAPNFEPLPGVKLLMVNGAPGLGSLEGRELIRLERFEAGVEFILQDASRQ
jgi:hypothetical protein